MHPPFVFLRRVAVQQQLLLDGSEDIKSFWEREFSGQHFFVFINGAVGEARPPILTHKLPTMKPNRYRI